MQDESTPACRSRETVEYNLQSNPIPNLARAIRVPLLFFLSAIKALQRRWKDKHNANVAEASKMIVICQYTACNLFQDVLIM